MFTRTTISQMPRQRSYFFKYMTMFFLGASAVLLVTQAFDISTSLTNSVQYIAQIVLTDNGANNGTTGITLGGSGGNAYFAGNVGIGTGSPSAKLEITSGGSIVLSPHADNTYIKMTTSVGGWGFTLGHNYFSSVISSPDFPIDMTAGNAEIYLSTGGNIGIGGNSSPSYLLDVSGTGRFTNDLLVDGYVGIGTSNPSANLQVLGTTTLDGQVTIGATAGLEGMWINGGTSPSGLSTILMAAGGIFYASGYYGQLTLGNNGDVGIGTNNPSAKLEVNGNIRLTSGGAIQADGNTNQLFLSLSGKVGIGTDTPSAMFTVAGGIKPISLSNTGTDICTDTANYPEGTIFYSTSLHALCYCYQFGSSLKVRDNQTCN